MGERGKERGAGVGMLGRAGVVGGARGRGHWAISVRGARMVLGRGQRVRVGASAARQAWLQAARTGLAGGWGFTAGEGLGQRRCGAQKERTRRARRTFAVRKLTSTKKAQQQSRAASAESVGGEKTCRRRCCCCRCRFRFVCDAGGAARGRGQGGEGQGALPGPVSAQGWAPNSTGAQTDLCARAGVGGASATMRGRRGRRAKARELRENARARTERGGKRRGGRARTRSKA